MRVPTLVQPLGSASAPTPLAGEHAVGLRAKPTPAEPEGPAGRRAADPRCDPRTAASGKSETEGQGAGEPGRQDPVVRAAAEPLQDHSRLPGEDEAGAVDG